MVLYKYTCIDNSEKKILSTHLNNHTAYALHTAYILKNTVPTLLYLYSSLLSFEFKSNIIRLEYRMDNISGNTGVKSKSCDVFASQFMRAFSDRMLISNNCISK